MRSGPNNRRSRGRGNGGRRGSQPRSNFESNGPDVRVRGSVQQVVDKYQALAREASTAGDPIKAEGYYQHAEHYLRVLTAQASSAGNNFPDQQHTKPNENNTELKKQVVDANPIISSDTQTADGKEVVASSPELPVGICTGPAVEETPDPSKDKQRPRRRRRPRKEVETRQEEKINEDPDVDSETAEASSPEQQSIV